MTENNTQPNTEVITETTTAPVTHSAQIAPHASVVNAEAPRRERNQRSGDRKPRRRADACRHQGGMVGQQYRQQGDRQSHRLYLVFGPERSPLLHRSRMPQRERCSSVGTPPTRPPPAGG